MQDFAEGFAERLAIAIAASRLDQQQIEVEINAGAGQLSRWKGGTAPSLEYLARLPSALGVSGHWLLTGQGDMRVPAVSDAARLQVIGEIADGTIAPETVSLLTTRPDPVALSQKVEQMREILRTLVEPPIAGEDSPKEPPLRPQKDHEQLHGT